MSDVLTPQVMLIALAVLAALSVGGLIYAIFYGRLNGSTAAERRIEQLSQRTSTTVTVARTQEAAARRRRAVQESLHDMEIKELARAKNRRSPPLELRIDQAGLNWSKQIFFLFGAIVGVIVLAVTWFAGAGMLPSLGLGLAATFGFPFWFVNFRRKRRFKAFLTEFPNSVDIIVRGVKAGLPLSDCLRIVAAESAEPVRSEFKHLHERQALGQTVGEAIVEMPRRIPLAEANFFAIAIMIQQQAGGNLSEALGNLSKVLRERARMRGKVKALSTEAKASAWIIGSLPVMVMVMVYLTSPDYIMRLFTDPIGHVILIASAFWMTIGVFVMRRMINFDF